ncbi:MAG: ribbon-helix-helix domain-containing protein [Firmicutes bacterium]|nr:ribbon-helix-helix domain-containing protein [Bacillota bacterium]
MGRSAKPNKMKEPHTITLEPEVWAALEELAAIEERSVSYILNRLAREHLQARGLLREGGAKG